MRRGKYQDASLRRKEEHAHRGVRVGSLKAVERERQDLERRIAAELREARKLDEERLRREQELEYEAMFIELERLEAKRAEWPLGDARNLVRQGYTVAHTVRRTGWSEEWFDDVRDGVW